NSLERLVERNDLSRQRQREHDVAHSLDDLAVAFLGLLPFDEAGVELIDHGGDGLAQLAEFVGEIAVGPGQPLAVATTDRSGLRLDSLNRREDESVQQKGDGADEDDIEQQRRDDDAVANAAKVGGE